MYIDTSHITRGGKTYTRHLLRESYRANGKVLHRTIANVSQCSEAEIEAMRLALRHKEALEQLGTIQDAVTLKQGLSFGAVWTVYHIARRLGIEQALGTTREGKLALWQVIARVIDQGSRLALHKKYPLRMLFVRKTGLFDLEKPSKRDQKVLIDR
jgi:hypothetical protein